MTRAEYLANWTGPHDRVMDAHRRYYAQFVTDEVKALVSRAIGVDIIVDSRDEDGAFNDIPLCLWDVTVWALPYTVRDTLKACGDTWSLATGVCVLKEAARQIRENFVAGV